MLSHNTMPAKRIAVIFGGHSTEYEVSLQSVSAVLEYIDHDRYDVITIGITREGNWYHYTGGYDRIREDYWWREDGSIRPVAVSVNRSAGNLIEFSGSSYSRIPVPQSVTFRESEKEEAMEGFEVGCSGFARVDMFLTPDGEIVFNEVNTIPGFTAHSRYPNMMKGIGLAFGDMLDKLLAQYE